MKRKINKRLEILSDRIRKGIPVSAKEALEVISYQEGLRDRDIKEEAMTNIETTNEQLIRVDEEFKKVLEMVESGKEWLFLTQIILSCNGKNKCWNEKIKILLNKRHIVKISSEGE